MNNELKLTALKNLPTTAKTFKRFKKWQSVFVSRTDRMKGKKIK